MEEHSEIKSLILEELSPGTTEVLEKTAEEPPKKPAVILQKMPPALPSAPETPKPPEPLSDETVTRHTTSLWKYLPIPAEEPEPFPEYLSRRAEHGGSRVTAARVRGKKHKHEGTNCDDWFEIAYAGDAVIIAVSDGAGSRRFSRIGARDACKAAAGYLSRAIEDAAGPELTAAIRLPLTDLQCQSACGVLAGIVQQAVLKACEAVDSAYYIRAADPAYEVPPGRKLELKDLSGTLLLAVAVPAGGEQLVISCQVGDGMIALLNTQAEYGSALRLMGEADSGEFSGETEFLTSAAMRDLETLQSKTKIFRGAADTLLVMSDGVADDYFPFQPEIYRLYFDLVANGILPGRGPAPSALTGEQVKMIKSLPDALRYPWVNDPGVEIALHYTDRICQAAGLSLQQLWEDDTPLQLSRLELDGRIQDAPAEERLLLWLDNYVVRGSFDDRTLVIVQI